MTNLKQPAFLIALTLIAAMGIACKKREPKLDTSLGTVKPVPEEKDDNEWPLYKVAAEGFSISLPSAWRQFDMSPGSFEKMMKDVTRQNPQFEQLAGNLRQKVAAGIKFFGFDETSVKTGNMTNVSVIRLANPIEISLDQVVEGNIQEFNKLPAIAKPVPHSRVKTALGEGERFKFVMPVVDPRGRTISTTITMYIFVSGKDNYTVTMTCLTDRDAEYSTTFDKIGQSFRLIKK
jgi:hypothetical protein